jgi:hypothetical protein
MLPFSTARNSAKPTGVQSAIKILPAVFSLTLCSVLGHSVCAAENPAAAAPLSFAETNTLPDAPGIATPANPSSADTAISAPPRYSRTAPGEGPSYVLPPEIPPLNAKRLIGNYIGSVFSFRNLIDAGLVSGIPNISAAPVQPLAPVGGFNGTNCNPALPPASNACTTYENAMNAYSTSITAWQDKSENTLRYNGRRAAVGLGASETRYFFGNLILPIALREDPRYLPASFKTGFAERMLHAVDSVAITKTWGGHNTVNFAKLGSTAIAAYAAGSFLPREARAPELVKTGFMLKYGLYSLAGDAATNVARELARTAVHKDLENFREHGESTEEHYYPLTISGKFASWLQDTYNPRHLVEGALIGGLPQINSIPQYPNQPVILNESQQIAYDNQIAAYGLQVQAWRDNLEESVRYHANRALGGVAESETEGVLKYFFLPAMFNMEGRYIRESSEAPFVARITHPFVSVFLTRTNSGRRTVNIPELGGTVGAAFIAQDVIYPDMNLNRLSRTSVAEQTIEFNAAADVVLDLIREFIPRHAF